MIRLSSQESIPLRTGKVSVFLFKTYFLIDECLVLIYDEIKRYEVQHDIFGGAGPSLDLSLIPAATNPEG